MAQQRLNNELMMAETVNQWSNRDPIVAQPLISLCSVLVFEKNLHDARSET
jgi:hypothetical protein